MTKPAPSPWKLTPYPQADLHQGYAIKDATGRVIAAVRSELYFDSLEQLEATAKLMASAPELLEMLKAFVWATEAYDDCTAAKELIAKVEGWR